MKHKILIGILIVAAVIIAGAFIFGNKSPTGVTVSDLEVTEINNTQNSNFIDAAELAKHTSMEDCWVAYKGKVYDVTAWLPKHPGSAQAILPYCGTSKEFEDAFTKKHGTSKAGLLMKVATFMGDFKTKGNLQ